MSEPSIIINGTNIGVTSDLDGNFTLDAPYSEATLMVSYLGYAPQEIPISNRTHIDVVLIEDAKALENVVVVGYTTQKKRRSQDLSPRSQPENSDSRPQPISTTHWPDVCRDSSSHNTAAANRDST